MLDPLFFEKPFLLLNSYSRRAKIYFSEKEKKHSEGFGSSNKKDYAKIFVFIVVLFSVVTISIGLYEYVRGDYDIITKFRVGAICNDGWRSSATGSGACSWHGGVNHWLYKDYVTGRHVSNHNFYFTLSGISFFIIFYLFLSSGLTRWFIISNYYNYFILLSYVVCAALSFPVTIIILILYNLWRLIKSVASQ